MIDEESQVYFIDSDQLPPEALKRKHQLESDPSVRSDHMKYLADMEIIDSDVKDIVLREFNSFDYNQYTAADVRRALSHERCTLEDFKALLSPAAAPFLEQMARKAEDETEFALVADAIGMQPQKSSRNRIELFIEGNGNQSI